MIERRRLLEKADVPSYIQILESGLDFGECITDIMYSENNEYDFCMKMRIIETDFVGHGFGWDGGGFISTQSSPWYIRDGSQAFSKKATDIHEIHIKIERGLSSDTITTVSDETKTRAHKNIKSYATNPYNFGADRFFWFKGYVNGEMKQHIVPANNLRTGKFGFWDYVSKTFTESQNN